MKVVPEISALWLQQLSLHPREPRQRWGGCAHNSAFPPAEAPTTTGNQAAEAAGPMHYIHYSSSCSGAHNGGPPSLAAATVPTNPMTLGAVGAPVAPAYTSPMSTAAMVPMTQVGHDMAEAPAILVPQ